LNETGHFTIVLYNQDSHNYNSFGDY